MEQLIEVNIGETPTLDSCKFKSPRLKEEMFKRFVEDLNKDRKKDMSFFYNNLDTLEIEYIDPYKGICYEDCPLGTKKSIPASVGCALTGLLTSFVFFFFNLKLSFISTSLSLSCCLYCSYKVAK